MKKTYLLLWLLVFFAVFACSQAPEEGKDKTGPGGAEAQYLLGVKYSKGQDVKQDWSQARSWWEKAAAQGHIEAQFSLGILYAKGEEIGRAHV